MPTKTAAGAGMACYIFYSDGDVELRITPEDDTGAVGRYSGDVSSGKISWADGGHSKYSSDGARYTVTRFGKTYSGSLMKDCP